MKHTRFFLFLALGAMMMPFVACEDDNEVRPADPNSETLMADTLWVHPPFDTAAALEGRVWRCSEYTIESKSADPVQQLTASGYVLTTTLGLGVPGLWIALITEWLLRAAAFRIKAKQLTRETA